MNKVQSTYLGVKSMKDEYWRISSLFILHAKNVIDYGTGTNDTPAFPNFQEVYGSTDKTYTQICNQAYINAVDFGLIDRNMTWNTMTLKEQADFVGVMCVYDHAFYTRLVVFSAEELVDWGMEKLVDFYSKVSYIVLYS